MDVLCEMPTIQYSARIGWLVWQTVRETDRPTNPATRCDAA